MRRAWMPLVALSLLAFGCAEQPRCVERGSASRPRLVVECNAGKVPVCGDDPLEIYSQSTGALLPVPPDSVANGSCAGIDGPCRPRVVCESAGAAPTCANGAAPTCVRGETTQLSEPTPPPMDSGVMDEDSGADTDAGADTDSGTDTDSGVADDAGPEDAGV